MTIGSIELAIFEQSQIGEARRKAISLSKELDFNEVEQGRLAIVVTEAAGNLIKHAKAGQLIFRRLKLNDANGIEVLSLDQGPGIEDIGRSLSDGFSTAGTPGTGLGSIQRQSDVFDIYSQKKIGTVLLSQIWTKNYSEMNKVATQNLEFGAINIPYPGESKCGDQWSQASYGDRSLIIVVDGLGHGPIAAEAASLALNTFHEELNLSPAQILEKIHFALRSTRGAAAAICELNRSSRLIRFSGIGNISGMTCPLGIGGEGRHFVSLAGILGHSTRKFQDFEYPWDLGSMLIMHSDGLMTRFELETYPGLRYRHPALISGVIFRDFKRGTDDATLLVMKEYG